MSREQLFHSKYKCMCTKCYELHDIDIYVSIDSNYPFTNHFTDIEFNGELCDTEDIECKNCGSFEFLTIIDEKIAKIVQILNKKGYITTNSCEGHSSFNGDFEEGSYALPYIAFDGWLSVPVEMFTTLPEGWYVDIDMTMVNIAIYYNNGTDGNVDIDFDENQLIEWALSLEQCPIIGCFDRSSVYPSRMISCSFNPVGFDEFMKRNALFGAYPEETLEKMRETLSDESSNN